MDRIKKFSENFVKSIFVALMYIFTIVLASVSASFSIMFYIEGQTQQKKLVIGILAGIFEMVKVSLAITYPAMKNRDRKTEKSIQRILYFALFMSIMASLYFFMMAGDKVSISPATKVIELIFANVAILNILPKTFIIFTANMSLSIMVEVLIIKLPSYALIFFKEVKEQEEREIVKTSTEKLMLIPKYIFSRLVDKLVNKYIPIEIVELKEPKKLLVEELENKAVEQNTEIKKDEKAEIKEFNDSDLPQNEIIEFLELLKSTVKEDGQILSERELMLQGYTREDIAKLKKSIKEYIYVKGKRTYFYKSVLDKLEVQV